MFIPIFNGIKVEGYCSMDVCLALGMKYVELFAQKPPFLRKLDEFALVAMGILAYDEW